MLAAGSAEKLLTTYQTTRCHNPEQHDLTFHRHLISYDVEVNIWAEEGRGNRAVEKTT